ncbi:MAG: hypothetical protein DWQ06_04370 [Calditrichaeota bacterium]|nr:MAG: hypothetical protein DWQ06_04370 [Calditrichota bacterium]
MIAFCTISSVFSQDLKVNAFVDKNEIKIGEPIDFTLEITAKNNIEIDFPEFKKVIGKFDVVEPAKVISQENQDDVITTVKYRLTRFELGEEKIPPINVDFRIPSDTTVNSIQSSAIAINVVSVLNSEQDRKIADIESPVEYPFDWVQLGIWILFGLVLIGVVYWIWKKFFANKPKKEKEIEEIKDTRSPWQKAMESLQKMKRDELAQKGDFKVFYTELTDVFRNYLGGITTVGTLEMTSSELLELTEKLKVQMQISQKLHQFLMFSDLVKFAKEIPTLTQAETHYEEMTEIINSIEQFLVERERARKEIEQSNSQTKEKSF